MSGPRGSDTRAVRENRALPDGGLTCLPSRRRFLSVVRPPQGPRGGTQPPERAGAGPAGAATGLAPKPTGTGIRRERFRHRCRKAGRRNRKGDFPTARSARGQPRLAARREPGRDKGQENGGWTRNFPQARPQGPGLSTGCRFSPWGRDGMVGNGPADRPPLAGTGSGPRSRGVRCPSRGRKRWVLGPCAPDAPFSIQNLSTRQPNFGGNTPRTS